jgi:Fe-S cluster assembly iron-binding protein IscA
MLEVTEKAGEKIREYIEGRKPSTVRIVLNEGG